MPKNVFQPGNTYSKGKGRPAGSGYRNELLACIDKTKFRELVEAIRLRAMEGDMAAAGVLVNRLVPALKPRGEPVPFTLPPGDILSQARAVLGLVADGSLSIEDGKGLLSALADVVKIEEAADLVKRLEALEAQGMSQ